MKTAIVVAGGPTVADYDVADLRAHGTVIGVNDACLYAACHHGVSMDRLWAENRVPEVLVRHPSMTLWLRQEATKNLPQHPRQRVFKCDYESCRMTLERGQLNGTNSGVCAINLAAQLGPSQIYLLGFDMCRALDDKPYWYPTYNWSRPSGGTGRRRYEEWRDQFKQIADDLCMLNIEVLNVTHNSAVTVFPKMSFKQFLRETA